MDVCDRVFHHRLRNANVTRKTWEAWEAGELAGKPAPKTHAELFFAKLEQIRTAPEHLGPDDAPRELVVVFRVDPGSRMRVPIDVVADDNYLGIEDAGDGWKIMKSMAIDLKTGRVYAHRTRYDPVENQHLMPFLDRHRARV